jgi:hypothetical protein
MMWCGFVCVCRLLFCIAIICNVEYRILKIKQHFTRLFILLALTIDVTFFKAVRMSDIWSYVYYFHCVLYVL